MTRGNRLLLAIEPLRQTDFSLGSEIINGIPPGTPTAESVKDTITNLIDYLQHEKDYPTGDAGQRDIEELEGDIERLEATISRTLAKPLPELYVSDKPPKPKRKGKTRRH